MNRSTTLIAAAAITGLVAAPAMAAGPHRGGDFTRTPTTTGSLSAANEKILAGMAEEEKLAHDVYVALAAKYPQAVQFSRIAPSEARHLQSIQMLMTRYGVTDPTAGMPAGQFSTPEVQQLYNDLIGQADDVADALAVGVKIEKMDIADLIDARAAVKKADVKRVYSNLLDASRNHLAAFSR